jgi:hypothetical protein
MLVITSKVFHWLQSLCEEKIEYSFEWMGRVNICEGCNWSTDGRTLFVSGDIDALNKLSIAGPSQVAHDMPLQFFPVSHEFVRFLKQFSDEQESIEIIIREKSFFVRKKTFRYELRDISIKNKVSPVVKFKVNPWFLYRALKDVKYPKMGLVEDSRMLYIKGTLDKLPCIATVMLLKDEQKI